MAIFYHAKKLLQNVSLVYSYAEPVLNKTNQISKSGINMSTFFNKRKRYVSKMTLHTFGIASNSNYVY